MNPFTAKFHHSITSNNLTPITSNRNFPQSIPTATERGWKNERSRGCLTGQQSSDNCHPYTNGYAEPYPHVQYGVGASRTDDFQYLPLTNRVCPIVVRSTSSRAKGIRESVFHRTKFSKRAPQSPAKCHKFMYNISVMCRRRLLSQQPMNLGSWMVWKWRIVEDMWKRGIFSWNHFGGDWNAHSCSTALEEVECYAWKTFLTFGTQTLAYSCHVHVHEANAFGFSQQYICIGSKRGVWKYKRFCNVIISRILKNSVRWNIWFSWYRF